MISLANPNVFGAPVLVPETPDGHLHTVPHIVPVGVKLGPVLTPIRHMGVISLLELSAIIPCPCDIDIGPQLVFTNFPPRHKIIHECYK